MLHARRHYLVPKKKTISSKRLRALLNAKDWLAKKNLKIEVTKPPSYDKDRERSTTLSQKTNPHARGKQILLFHARNRGWLKREYNDISKRAC